MLNSIDRGGKFKLATTHQLLRPAEREVRRPRRDVAGEREERKFVPNGVDAAASKAGGQQASKLEEIAGRKLCHFNSICPSVRQLHELH